MRTALACLVIPAALTASILCGCARESGDRVYGAPGAVEPLQPGQRVPSVGVLTLHGEPLDLAEQVRERGALLVFYRGGW